MKKFLAALAMAACAVVLCAGMAFAVNTPPTIAGATNVNVKGGETATVDFLMTGLSVDEGDFITTIDGSVTITDSKGNTMTGWDGTITSTKGVVCPSIKDGKSSGRLSYSAASDGISSDCKLFTVSITIPDDAASGTYNVNSAFTEFYIGHDLDAMNYAEKLTLTSGTITVDGTDPEPEPEATVLTLKVVSTDGTTVESTNTWTASQLKAIQDANEHSTIDGQFYKNNIWTAYKSSDYVTLDELFADAKVSVASTDLVSCNLDETAEAPDKRVNVSYADINAGTYNANATTADEMKTGDAVKAAVALSVQKGTGNTMAEAISALGTASADSCPLSMIGASGTIGTGGNRFWTGVKTITVTRVDTTPVLTLKVNEADGTSNSYSWTASQLKAIQDANEHSAIYGQYYKNGGWNVYKTEDYVTLSELFDSANVTVASNDNVALGNKFSGDWSDVNSGKYYASATSSTDLGEGVATPAAVALSGKYGFGSTMAVAISALADNDSSKYPMGMAGISDANGNGGNRYWTGLTEVVVNRAVERTISVAVDSVGANTITAKDAVVSPTEGGAIQYAISTTNAAPTDASAWQDSKVFSNLTPNTTYYVFARVAKSANLQAATSTGVEAKTLITDSGLTVQILKVDGTVDKTRTFTAAEISNLLANNEHSAINGQYYKNNKWNVYESDTYLTVEELVGAAGFTIDAKDAVRFDASDSAGKAVIAYADANSGKYYPNASSTSDLGEGETTPAAVAFVGKYGSGETMTAAIAALAANDSSNYPMSMVGISDANGNGGNRYMKGINTLTILPAVERTVTVAIDSTEARTITAKDAVVSPTAGGAVQYAISTTNTAPTDESAWQDSKVFSNLTPNTTYYVFARVAKSANLQAATSTGVEAKTPKEMPEVTVPTFDPMTYNPTATLPTFTSSQWAWTNAQTTPTVKGGAEGYEASFAPTEAEMNTYDYAKFAAENEGFTWNDATKKLTTTIKLTVNKADVTISTNPTASDLIYGQTLADSTLSGGKASVGGTFDWETSTIAPEAAEANEYNVVFTPADTDNYKTPEAVKVAVKVSAKDVTSSATIDAVGNQTYTGSAIEPALTIKDGDTVLAKGTDYTVVFSNNTAVGTASYKVTFTGNYTGTKEGTFTIVEDRHVEVDNATSGATADTKALEEILASKSGVEGSQVIVDLVINKGADSDADKSAVLNALTSDYKVVFYDADLLLKVDGSTTNLGSDNDKLIAITYAFDFTNKANVRVIRVHDGVMDELTTTPNADGEYVKFNTESNSITVYAKKYSTYSIAYTENQDAPVVGPTDGKTIAKTKIAKTGDFTNVIVYALIVVLVIAAAVVVLARRRKSQH